MSSESKRMPRWVDALIGAAIVIMLVLCTFENHSRVGRMITTAFAVGAISWSIYRGRIPAGHLRGLVDCVLLIYAAIMVSCFFSIDRLYSFKNFLYYQHLGFGLLFLCMAAWATTTKRQTIVLVGFATAGAVSAILGILVLFKGRELVNAGYVDQLTDFVYKAQDASGAPYYRAKGILESYTKSAAVFIMALPAILALLLNAIRRRNVGVCIVLILAGAVSAWYLVMTKSRGAWLGAAVSCILTLMLLKGRWWMPVVAVAALLAGLVASPSARGRATSFFSDATRPDLLFSGRFMLWNEGIRPIREHPLAGIGYGGNIFLTEAGLSRYELRSAGFRQPDLHNVYLQTLAETGIIGFTAYALLLVALGRIAIREIRVQKQSGVMIGLAVAAPALLGMLAFGFVYNFNERHVAQLLAAMIALIPASQRGAHSPPA